MNELDLILIAIILVGVGIGLRRGLVRVLLSIAGIYFTVIIAGYAYKPIGDTLARALGRIGTVTAVTAMHNLTYIVFVIGVTVVVEYLSRSTFEETRIGSLGRIDNLLGGVVGICYGALWASLFLVPGQYSVAQTGDTWSTAVFESKLVPTLNTVFQRAVVNIVSIFFIGGTPELYLNRVSRQLVHLFFNLTYLRFHPI